MKIHETIKSNLYEYKRIISISKKPSKEEYISIIKVSAIGIGLIGLIGFIIQIIGQIF